MRFKIIICLLLSTGVQPVLPASFKTQVAAGTDDAKTYNNNLSTGDIDAVVGYTNGYSCDYLARFTDIAVPSGATIDSAFLSLHSSSSQSGTTCNGLLYAEDTGSAAAFSTWSDYANRYLSDSIIAWSNIGAHTYLTWYRSPDIKNIVQEIVNRADWSSGQAMAVFIQDDNSDAGACRRFYQYERPGSEGASACSLLVFYTEGTSGEETYPRRRRNIENLFGKILPDKDNMILNTSVLDLSNFTLHTGSRNEQTFSCNRADFFVCKHSRCRYRE